MKASELRKIPQLYINIWHQEIIEACIEATKRGDKFIHYTSMYLMRKHLLERLISDGYHIEPRGGKDYYITWGTYKPVGRLTLDNLNEEYRKIYEAYYS